MHERPPATVRGTLSQHVAREAPWESGDRRVLSVRVGVSQAVSLCHTGMCGGAAPWRPG